MTNPATPLSVRLLLCLSPYVGLRNRVAFPILRLTGAGNDILNAGNGTDRLFGENGKDILNGSNGNDALDGGAGADICNGGSGSDSGTACEIVSDIP